MLQHFQYIVEIAVSFLGFIIFPVFVKKPRVQLYAVPLFGASVVGVILFLFGIFGAGQAGIITVRVLNLLLMVLTVVFLLRKKLQSKEDFAAFKSQFLFLLLFLFLFFGLGMLSKLWFYHVGWDEWSFWDEYVRSLMRYGEKVLLTVHPAYPIGISLFQYYFCSAAVQNEHIVYFATVYIMMAAIFYIYSAFRSQTNKWMLPVTSLMCFCFLYLFDSELFTLFIDALLGVLFGAFLVNVFHTKKRDLSFCIVTAIQLCFFTQMKDTSLVLTLGTLIIAAFSWILDYYNAEGSLSRAFKKISGKDIRNFLILAIPAPTTSLMWKIRNNVLQITDKLDFSQINLKNMTELLTNGTDWQRTTWTNIVNQIFNEEYTFMGMSAFAFTVVLLLIVFVLFFANRDRKYLIINAFLFLGLILFNLLQNLHYMFSMEKWAADELNSYERYLSPFLIGWSIFIITYIFSKVFSKDPQENHQRVFQWLALVTIGFTLIKTPMERVFMIPPRQSEKWQKTMTFYEDYGDFIPANSTIKMLSPDIWYDHYYMMWNIFVGQAKVIRHYDHELINQFDSAELTAYLEENHVDFICTGYLSETFWAEHTDMFDQPIIDEKAYHLYQRVSPGKYELIERE